MITLQGPATYFVTEGGGAALSLCSGSLGRFLSGPRSTPKSACDPGRDPSPHCAQAGYVYGPSHLQLHPFCISKVRLETAEHSLFSQDEFQAVTFMSCSFSWCSPRRVGGGVRPLHTVPRNRRPAPRRSTHSRASAFLTQSTPASCQRSAPTVCPGGSQPFPIWSQLSHHHQFSSELLHACTQSSNQTLFEFFCF